MSEIGYSELSEAELIRRIFKLAVAILAAVAVVAVPIYLIASWQWSEYRSGRCAQAKAELAAYEARNEAEKKAFVDALSGVPIGTAIATMRVIDPDGSIQANKMKLLQEEGAQARKDFRQYCTE